jgi:hypothetical protein
MLMLSRLTLRSRRFAPVARFDQSFDELLASRYEENAVSCERSIEFLNWRFVGCPIANRYHIHALSDGDDIRGFVVLRRGQRQHKSTLYVDELIAYKGARIRMIDFIVDQAYQLGVDEVCYEGLGDGLSSRLRRRGFLSRNNGHYFMVYANEESLATCLAKRSNWSLRIADSDIGFRLDR